MFPLANGLHGWAAVGVYLSSFHGKLQLETQLITTGSAGQEKENQELRDATMAKRWRTSGAGLWGWSSFTPPSETVLITHSIQYIHYMLNEKPNSWIYVSQVKISLKYPPKTCGRANDWLKALADRYMDFHWFSGVCNQISHEGYWQW